MTLTTHAAAGAALATLVPEHPLIGFAAGFASHFLLDAIPHYDYAIRSGAVDPKIGAPLRLDRAFMLDMVRIGSDALAGLLLSMVLFAAPGVLLAVLAGAVGGILPDALQFVYAHVKREPLVTLQRFHQWIHAKRRLELEGKLMLGVISQLALVALIAAVAWRIPSFAI